MRDRPAARPRLSPARLVAPWFALWFALAPAAGWAAPDEPVDPVMKMLAERGLVPEPEAASAAAESASPAASPGLLRRVQEHASAMVIGAMNFLGVRYQRGGTTAEGGFDCSGFTRYVFGMSLGLMLPRSADEQAMAPGFVAVQRGDLQPGDLVFFNTLKRTFSHVGIYIGENRFIHAPRSGQVVRTEDMSFAYWAKRFTGARRAQAVADAPLAAPLTVSAAASATGVIGR